MHILFLKKRSCSWRDWGAQLSSDGWSGEAASSVRLLPPGVRSDLLNPSMLIKAVLHELGAGFCAASVRDVREAIGRA